MLHDQLLRRAGPGGEALVPSLSRALADLQERLIYRCGASQASRHAHAQHRHARLAHKDATHTHALLSLRCTRSRLQTRHPLLPQRRAQAFIKDQVEGFSPRPQDLAYPAKLEAAAAAAATAAAAEGDAAAADDKGDEQVGRRYAACLLAS